MTPIDRIDRAPTPRAPIVRNRHHVLREYDIDKWPAVRQNIAELLALGETELTRVVAQAAHAERKHSDIEHHATIIGGRLVDLPTSIAWGGFYGIIVNRVLRACRQDTGAILELGSGWGRNLFNLWLSGGPRRAAYYACELTDSGRASTEDLARLSPEMNLTVAPFDYLSPVYPDVGREIAHLVLFTVHSIEQIPHISEDFITFALPLAKRISALHFEPIGWQIDGDRRGRCGSSFAYAKQHDYNHNFWKVLQNLENDGLITVATPETELVGLNTENSTTLVEWTKN